MTKTYTKRSSVILCIAVALLMLFTAVILMPNLHADGNIAEGTWGTCPWVIDAGGTLTISAGNGAAQAATDTPWNAYSEQITKVNIAGKVVLNKVSNNIFFGLSKVTAFKNLSNLDTSNVESMQCMFFGCASLTSIDISSFDTSKVTAMGGLFEGCVELVSVNVNNLNTSNVLTMDGMFSNCKKLTSIDVSAWDMSKVYHASDFLFATPRLGSLTVNNTFKFHMSDGVHGESYVIPMEPAIVFFPNATGKWKNIDTGDVYAADSLPNNVAATYVPECVAFLQIPVIKAITGDTPETNSTFTFNISAHATTPDAPLPETTTCTATGATTTNFGFITFTDVGEYYYDITETDDGAEGYTYDDTTYIVCVAVINRANNIGYTASIAAIWKDTIVNEESAKFETVTFSNTYEAPAALPGSLTLTKHVTGELASKKLGFTFTVTFSDNTYGYNAGSKGTIADGTGTITLRHGESVTFPDLPADVTYTITETNGDAYTTSVDNNGSTVPNKTVNGSVAEDASVRVTYTNDLVYTPVVGLSMTTLPFLLLGVLAVGGAAVLITKKVRAR